MSYKVNGVGIVRIKMFDGVIMTLTNVRHVPNLKKTVLVLWVLSTHKVISILLKVEY